MLAITITLQSEELSSVGNIEVRLFERKASQHRSTLGILRDSAHAAKGSALFVRKSEH